MGSFLGVFLIIALGTIWILSMAAVGYFYFDVIRSMSKHLDEIKEKDRQENPDEYTPARVSNTQVPTITDPLGRPITVDSISLHEGVMTNEEAFEHHRAQYRSEVLDVNQAKLEESPEKPGLVENEDMLSYAERVVRLR